MNDNRPISEIYAEVGEEWATAEARAQILEDTKSSYLAQMVLRIQANDSKVALNRAETEVKASLEWTTKVQEIVDARKQANLLKVKMESVRMAYGEWNNQQANERMVAKL